MARIGLAAVALIALLAASQSLRARIDDGGTPNWDSASHGLQGFVLAQDVARLDVANLAADALGHRYRYPPGHPALLAVAYLLFGPSWWTAIGVSCLLFAALAIVLYATAESKAAGWIAAILALTSPALLAISGQILLEILAAILMVLSLRLYARSLEDDAAVRQLGWTLTVFMLTAAQYALCVIATLMAFEAWRSRVWLTHWIVRFSKSKSLFHPLHVLIAAAFLTAAAVRLTGGWSIPIGSRTLSMTRAGGPFIAAALLAGLRVAWLCWKHRERLRDVPKRFRDIFLTAVVPIYAWVFVIYPPRFQQISEWISRPSVVHERTDPAHWTYYPGYFANGGHAAVAVGLGVAALVVASFFRRGRPERIRFLQWAVIAGALLVMGHHARQTRFIVPFLVAWWLLSSETLVSCLPAMKARLMAGAAATLGIVLPGLALYRSELPAIVSPPSIHKDYAALLPQVVNSLGDAPSIRVIGGIEGLSHHLFEWELRKRVDLRTRRMRFNLDKPQSDPRAVYDEWMAGEPESLVIAIEPMGLRMPRRLVLSGFDTPARPDWPHYTMLYLQSEPRYEKIHELQSEAAQVCIRIYRRKM